MWWKLAIGIILFFLSILDLKYKKISLVGPAIIFFIGIVNVSDFKALILGVIPGIILSYLAMRHDFLGLGDGLVITALGANVGIFLVTYDLFIACILSSIVGLIMITFLKKSKKTRLPFLPFIFLGYIGGML